MKYLSLLLVFCFSLFLSTSSFAQADAISKYFDKYLDDERFTVVYVSGKLFDMFSSATEDLDDEEVQAIRSVVSDMKGLRILTTETNAAEFYKEALSIINKNEYEVLMTVREGKHEQVQFLAKDDGENINELLLLVGSETEGDEDFVLMSFVGSINLSEISKLEKAFDNKHIEIHTNDQDEDRG